MKHINNHIQFADNIKLYPNPATDYIEINLNNVMPAQAGIHDLSVRVYDV